MVYKLTDKYDCTYGDTKWGPGVTHSGTGKGPLCTKGWIHYYENPLLAVIFNPIHGKFKKPHLWTASVECPILTDRGLKWGAKSLTTHERIDLPVISLTQKVAFGILCALQVYSDPEYVKWAENWLSNKDRTAYAAYAADAANAAANAAADAAAYAAADAAADAADAAAYAAADAAADAAIDFNNLISQAMEVI